MADTVAIVSVASSATVAVAVPFISARLERKRLDHQERQEGFEELRMLLDESAVRLNQGSAAMRRLLLTTPGAGEREELIDRLTQLVFDAHGDNTRLVLRLGRSHLTVGHYRTIGVLDMGLAFVVRGPGGGLPFSEPRELIDEWDRAHEDFVMQAREVVGVSLGSVAQEWISAREYRTTWDEPEG